MQKIAGESPLRKAGREARSVLLVSVLAAVGFNLFANDAARVPWIRTAPQLDQASDEDLFGTDSLAVDTTVVDEPVDTLPDQLEPDPDSLAAVEEERLAQERRQDSIRAAKRRADSLAALKKEPQVDAEPGKVLEVNTAQVRKIYQQGNATFIDARRDDQFAEGHIPGAINLYAYDFGSQVGKVLPIPRDKLVVIYCDGGLCELSHELANEMIKIGFKRIVVYTGGWNDWSRSDLPRETE